MNRTVFQPDSDILASLKADLRNDYLMFNAFDVVLKGRKINKNDEDDKI